VIANFAVANTDSELAARLLDVGPDGKERLVARGLLRPRSGNDVVFQLHPQGYRFAGGHTVKLELLPSDAPYARPSNAQAPITIGNLELRLPVREQPGAVAGLVKTPAPPGRAAAASTAASTSTTGAASLAGPLRATRKAVRAPLRCTGGPCSGSLLLARGKRVLARGSYSLTEGARASTRLRLTRAGRKVLAKNRRSGHRSLLIRLRLEDAGRPAPVDLTRRLRLRH
jgi:hypothetical protein